MEKLLIPIYGHDVAPRFDLATEALIVSIEAAGKVETERTIVLSRASSDELCRLILAEGVRTVICGGIEEEYFHYLIWKKVQVLDSVVGSYHRALQAFIAGQLKAGAILIDRPEG